MAHATLTYGVLPTREVIESLAPAGYRVDLKGADARVVDLLGLPVDTTGTWTTGELWDVLVALTQAWGAGVDAAGDLASAILTTLGVEWV